MIYLASPYTHDDPKVENERYVNTCKVAGILLEQGYHIFSPIAHTHAICKHASLSGKFAFYRDLDLHMISICSGFFVLQMDGWMSSVGIQAEIEYLKKNYPAIKPQYVLTHLTIASGKVVFE